MTQRKLKQGPHRYLQAAHLREETGQMSVELAFLLPVIAASIYLFINLGAFIALCSAFDRVSLDLVLAQGTSASPASKQTIVQQELEASFARYKNCSVEVALEDLSGGGGSAKDSFLISPHFSRFTCRLRFQPFPRLQELMGIWVGSPLYLEHERTIVVDCYRSAVVM